MVQEWVKSVKKFTHLQPFLHYGGSTFNTTAYKNISSNQPWRYIIITTVETLHSRWSNDNVWSERPFHRMVLDEGHRLRSSDVAQGKRSLNSMADRLCKIKCYRRWVLTATPLVNSLSDLRWILTFLQRPEWLFTKIPAFTFAEKAEIRYCEDESTDFEDIPSVFDGSKPNVDIHPTRRPRFFTRSYNNGAIVHCTTKVWDKLIKPDLDEIKRLVTKKEKGN